ncbi:hypothetical protein BDV06DRAFT_156859 [Aspergillus oleicola]
MHYIIHSIHYISCYDSLCSCSRALCVPSDLHLVWIEFSSLNQVYTATGIRRRICTMYLAYAYVGYAFFLLEERWNMIMIDESTQFVQ